MFLEAFRIHRFLILLRGWRFSMLLAEIFSTIMFSHSKRASIDAIPCPEMLRVKMISGENLLERDLRMSEEIFPLRLTLCFFPRACSLYF